MLKKDLKRLKQKHYLIKRGNPLFFLIWNLSNITFSEGLTMTATPKDKIKIGFIEVESIKYRNNAKIFRTVMIRIDSITAIQDCGDTIYIYINDIYFEVNIGYEEFKNKLKLL